MYQMLIVDDNNKDRRVLRELFQWERFDVKVAGEAVNGKDALQKVEQCPPNILITDIFMPVMNGIDLVAEVSRKYPEIKIIFMSFSEEFEFAKSAIDMSVYGYIVKPLRSADVKKAIEKVLSVYHREEKSAQEKESLLTRLEKARPVLQESFVRDLLFGVYRKDEDILRRLEFFGLPRYQDILVRVYCIRERECSEEQSVAEQYSITYLLKERLTVQNGSGMVYVVQTAAHEFTLLHISLQKNNVGLNSDGLNYIMGIYPILGAIFTGDFVVGISNSSQQIADIHDLFKQACKAAETVFYTRQIPVVLYQEVAGNDTSITMNTEGLYTQIEELLLTGEEQAVHQFLREQLENPGEKDVQYLRYQVFSIINVLQILLLEKGKNIKDLMRNGEETWKKLNDVRSVPALVQWLETIMLQIKRNFFDYSKSRNAQLVQQVKFYIQEHYDQQLGADEIAQQVFMSSKQMNNIFRKETGQSVFEYLVAYRIHMAKQMLAHPDARINEVAYQVGYTNLSHFNLMFKKHTGKTPREYRSLGNDLRKARA